MFQAITSKSTTAAGGGGGSAEPKAKLVGESMTDGKEADVDTKSME